MAQKHNEQYVNAPMTRLGTVGWPDQDRRVIRSSAFVASKWTAENPILQLGEVGYETDTNKLKVGDGVTKWNDLPYAGDGTGSSLPDQSGHAGEFLTTDGSDASWAAVDALPSQTGYSGRVLGTDGFVAGWVEPEIVQRSTMPQASADELGNIYQFVGATDANYTNGYFYKCVSDGQEPATYSWTQVSVQPAPSGLPDQTGQSGKFLTTDGTDASWSDKPLVNTATGTGSLTVGPGIVTTKQNSTAFGQGTSVAGSGSGCATCVGYQASSTSAAGSVSIGYKTSVTATQGIAIAGSTGNVYTQSSATHAIQIGNTGANTINSDANTFKVANGNGNFEIMSADGTVPHARLTNAVVSNSITIAVADWNGGTTCTKTVSGLTATSTVWVAPDNASQSDYLTAGVYASAQTTDTITFTCTTTPTSSLTVNVIYC